MFKIKKSYYLDGYPENSNSNKIKYPRIKIIIIIVLRLGKFNIELAEVKPYKFCGWSPKCIKTYLFYFKFPVHCVPYKWPYKASQMTAAQLDTNQYQYAQSDDDHDDAQLDDDQNIDA